MKKPYIFGHRGAMGYEIQNTMPSFEKAVEMGAGIETDVQLTKDNELICLHDPTFKINSKIFNVKELTYEELKSIEFQDNRVIPTVEEVFQRFKNKKNKLRYSCDINNKNSGLKLIKLARKHGILDKVEITDMRMRVLSYLRKNDEEALLVHSLPFNIINIDPKNLDFEEIKDNNIHVINLKAERFKNKNNLFNIIDNDLKCYVWGVNSKFRMKRVLRWKYKHEIVEAIYTDYPDVLIKMRDEYFS